MKKIRICFIFLLVSFFLAQTTALAFTNTRKAYEKTGNVFWEVKTKKKMVAITFDDGPHPIFTPQILDILAKYHAKATFFVAGNKVSRFPEILKREAEEGHEIANHTYHHYYNRHMDAATLTAELNQTDQIIEGFTGSNPTLYRPVGGLYNDTIIDTAVKNGKLVILWSHDPRDWSGRPASQIFRDATKDIHPGSIILLHDWYETEFTTTSQTVKALDDMLKFLYRNGYECVTVSELLYQSMKITPDMME